MKKQIFILLILVSSFAFGQISVTPDGNPKFPNKASETTLVGLDSVLVTKADGILRAISLTDFITLMPTGGTGSLSPSDQTKLDRISITNGIDLDLVASGLATALQPADYQTITDLSLSGNILSITISDGNTVTVDLSAISGGGGSNDGNDFLDSITESNSVYTLNVGVQTAQTLDLTSLHNDARAQTWLTSLYPNLDTDSTDDADTSNFVLRSGVNDVGFFQLLYSNSNTVPFGGYFEISDHETIIGKDAGRFSLGHGFAPGDLDESWNNYLDVGLDFSINVKTTSSQNGSPIVTNTLIKEYNFDGNYTDDEDVPTKSDIDAAITAINSGGTDNQTAAEVTYDNTISGLDATDVQDAIDEAYEAAVKAAEGVEDYRIFQVGANKIARAMQPNLSDFDSTSPIDVWNHMVDERDSVSPSNPSLHIRLMNEENILLDSTWVWNKRTGFDQTRLIIKGTKKNQLNFGAGSGESMFRFSNGASVYLKGFKTYNGVNSGYTILTSSDSLGVGEAGTNRSVYEDLLIFNEGDAIKFVNPFYDRFHGNRVKSRDGTALELRNEKGNSAYGNSSYKDNQFLYGPDADDWGVKITSDNNAQNITLTDFNNNHHLAYAGQAKPSNTIEPSEGGGLYVKRATQLRVGNSHFEYGENAIKTDSVRNIVFYGGNYLLPISGDVNTGVAFEATNQTERVVFNGFIGGTSDIIPFKFANDTPALFPVVTIDAAMNNAILNGNIDLGNRKHRVFIDKSGSDPFISKSKELEPYDNTVSGLVATNIKDALDELAADTGTALLDPITKTAYDASPATYDTGQRFLTIPGTSLPLELLGDYTFDIDDDTWAPNANLTISGGTATIVGSGSIGASAANHILEQTVSFDPNEPLDLEVRGRRTNGTGNITIGQDFNVWRNVAFTNTMTTYNYSILASNVNANTHFTMGADSGSDYDIEYVSVKQTNGTAQQEIKFFLNDGVVTEIYSEPATSGSASTGFHSNLDITGVGQSLSYSNQVTGSGYPINNKVRSGTVQRAIDNLRVGQVNENYAIDVIGDGPIFELIPGTATLIGEGAGTDTHVRLNGWGKMDIIEDTDGIFEVVCSNCDWYTPTSAVNEYDENDAADTNEGDSVGPNWSSSNTDTFVSSTDNVTDGTYALKATNLANNGSLARMRYQDDIPAGNYTLIFGYYQVSGTATTGEIFDGTTVNSHTYTGNYTTGFATQTISFTVLDEGGGVGTFDWRVYGKTFDSTSSGAEWYVDNVSITLD